MVLIRHVGTRAEHEFVIIRPCAGANILDPPDLGEFLVWRHESALWNGDMRDQLGAVAHRLGRIGRSERSCLGRRIGHQRGIGRCGGVGISGGNDPRRLCGRLGLAGGGGYNPRGLGRRLGSAGRGGRSRERGGHLGVDCVQINRGAGLRIGDRQTSAEQYRREEHQDQWLVKCFHCCVLKVQLEGHLRFTGFPARKIGLNALSSSFLLLT